jgi:predicted nuclease of predicted toxin-antitoxin system
MRDDAIRAYQRRAVSAEDELEVLGDAFAENAFLYAAQIVAGTVDHWELLPFYEAHRDIPVYKYAYANRCCLLAVEDDGAGDRMVTIMLACSTGKPVSVGRKMWDGIDMDALRVDFLLPRLKEYFP